VQNRREGDKKDDVEYHFSFLQSCHQQEGGKKIPVVQAGMVKSKKTRVQ